jgi:phosphoglycerol transferase MdoB-like AlkP superfamily enzyme
MVETLIVLLVAIALFIGAAWGALWIINNFFPAPWHMPARVIAGLIFLIILLIAVSNYFGGSGDGRWRFPGPSRSHLTR